MDDVKLIFKYFKLNSNGPRSLALPINKPHGFGTKIHGFKVLFKPKRRSKHSNHFEINLSPPRVSTLESMRESLVTIENRTS